MYETQNTWPSRGLHGAYYLRHFGPRIPNGHRGSNIQKACGQVPIAIVVAMPANEGGQDLDNVLVLWPLLAMELVEKGSRGDWRFVQAMQAMQNLLTS